MSMRQPISQKHCFEPQISSLIINSRIGRKKALKLQLPVMPLKILKSKDVIRIYDFKCPQHSLIWTSVPTVRSSTGWIRGFKICSKKKQKVWKSPKKSERDRKSSKKVQKSSKEFEKVRKSSKKFEKVRKSSKKFEKSKKFE